MERPDEVTRFLRCGGMNCDCSCGKDGKVENCLTWRVHGYVEQLEAQVPKWISVEERLPEKTGYYLTAINCEKGRWVEVNTFDGGVRQWAHDLFHGTCIEDATPFVTHWMPLPEPPTKKE